MKRLTLRVARLQPQGYALGQLGLAETPEIVRMGGGILGIWADVYARAHGYLVVIAHQILAAGSVDGLFVPLVEREAMGLDDVSSRDFAVIDVIGDAIHLCTGHAWGSGLGPQGEVVSGNLRVVASVRHHLVIVIRVLAHGLLLVGLMRDVGCHRLKLHTAQAP